MDFSNNNPLILSMKTELLDEVKVFINTYKNLGICKNNLDKNNNTAISNLINKDLQWLEYYKYSDSQLNNFIKESFGTLSVFLKEWRDNCNKKHGSFSVEKEKKRCEQLIKTCYLAILQVFLYYDSVKIDTTNDVARTIFAENKQFPCYLNDMIVNGIVQLIKQFTWPILQNHMLVEDLISNHLNKNIILFNEKGFNLIFLNEVKSRSPTIFDRSLEAFIRNFYGSLDYFRKFMNRNFLYDIIYCGLQNNGVDYSSLFTFQSEFNCEFLCQAKTGNINPELKYIFNIKIFKYQGQDLPTEWENSINLFGLHKSKRYIKDCLVTIGNNNSIEFTNDISLQNLIDSNTIAAIIYILRNQLYIVDTSDKGSLSIKLMQESEVEIEDDMVIVIGERHKIIAYILEGCQFFNHRYKSIQLQPFEFESDTSINSAVVNEEKPLTIGSSPGCDFIINSSDVNERHAEIHCRDQNFYLKAVGSSRVSYKLKKGRDIKSRSPESLEYPKSPKQLSSALMLENKMIFFIEDYDFLVNKIVD